jgi:hypothetical protein
MNRCKGCATYSSIFAKDSSRCLLEKSPECVCAICLIKMVCLRKLECFEFCSKAALMHDNKSSYVRCLKNMYPNMYKRLVSEGKIL